MTEGGREAGMVTDLTEEHIKTEKMFAFMYVCRHAHMQVCTCMSLLIRHKCNHVQENSPVNVIYACLSRHK